MQQGHTARRTGPTRGMHRWILALAAAGVAACGTAAGPDDGLFDGAHLLRDTSRLLQTGALEYTFEDRGASLRVDIPFEFRNVTGRTVYIVNCHGAYGLELQRRVGKSWRTIWAPAVPECLGPPIVIPSGDTRAEMIRVEGWLPGGNTYPDLPAGDLSGVYRIVVGPYVHEYDIERGGWGDALPIDQRTSNSFRIIDPRY